MIGGQIRNHALGLLKAVVYVVGLLAALIGLGLLLSALFGESEFFEDPKVMLLVLGALTAAGLLLRGQVRRLVNVLRGHGGSHPAEIRRRVEEEVRWEEVPRVEDWINRVEVRDGERRLLAFWQNESHHERGVLLATDRRLILAQAPGMELRDKHAPASRIPGKIVASIPYSEITAISARYTGLLSAMARLLDYFNDTDREVASPLPRVRILSTEQEPIECAVSPVDARQLLSLLASKTRVTVRGYWLDRLRRPGALKAVGPQASSEIIHLADGSADLPPVSLREWPGLAARYAWTRPIWVRVVGALALGYTIAVSLDGGVALARWLGGLLCMLLGFGMILASRRPASQIAHRQKHADSGSPLDLMWSHLPARPAQTSQTAGGVLLVAAGSLFAALSVLAL
jgi:hypothetical protein